MKLAFYKGSPKNDWLHTISHYGIRLWTFSKWSHAELVIDDICWSSSARDGGVRSKQIDLNSGRWDIIDLNVPESLEQQALAWFHKHNGAKYDYRNILRFVFTPTGHDKNKWVCFEAIAEALNLAGSHKLTANDLYEWALKQKSN
jgi:hypothetical protein